MVRITGTRTASQHRRRVISRTPDNCHRNALDWGTASRDRRLRRAGGNRRGSGIVKSWSLLALMIGLALLVGVVLAYGLGAITAALGALGFLGLLAILCWRSFVISIMGCAWWCLGRRLQSAPPAAYIWGRFVRESGSEALPLTQLGGCVLGARALSMTGVPGRFAAASTIVDIAIEFLAKTPYMMAGLGLLEVLKPHNPVILPALIALLVSVVLGLLFIAVQSRGAGLLERLSERIARLWQSESKAVAGGNAVSGNAALDSTTLGSATLGSTALANTDAGKLSGGLAWEIRRIHARRGMLGRALLLHSCCWFLGGLEAWLSLHLMGVKVTVGAVLALDSILAVGRSLIFFIPNAIGVQEAAYAALAGLLGVPPATAVALSLLRRGRDLLIGLPVLLGWQVMESRRALARRQAE